MSNRHIHILYVTTIATTASAFLTPLIRHYRALGGRVDVAANGVSGTELEECCDTLYQMNWSRSLRHCGRSVMEGLRLRRIIESGRYDIVHVHTAIASFCTRIWMPRKVTPRPGVIYTAHGFHFHSGGGRVTNALWRSAEMLAAKWTDYLVVINQEDADFAMRHNMLSPDRIVRMPGIGVDTAQMASMSPSLDAIQKFRQELGISGADKLFVMVAEFNLGKRHADALHAFARLSAAHCHLAFAGNGPLMESVRMLAQQLGISDRVHFLGFRRDIPVLLGSSDFMLLPSEREGLPRSIMEAFCLGVPVIATDIRGSRDLVAGRGFLVPVGNPEALAGAIRRVLEHPDEAAAMAASARTAVRQYDVSNVIRMHDDLYERVLQSQASEAYV